MPPIESRVDIVIASRGMSRGIADTRGPQVVVRAEVEVGALYVAGFIKNLSSNTSKGLANGMIGFRTDIAGFQLGGRIAYKQLVAAGGSADAAALELGGSLFRRKGPLTGMVSYTWSPDDLNRTGQSHFVEGTAGYKVSRLLIASATIAHRERKGGIDYNAFNVGFTAPINRVISIDIRYYDTSRRELGHPYQRQLSLSGKLTL
jgi:hypothetical protein